MQQKQRIDLLLVEQGLFPSREKARAALMAGLVFVDGQRVDKPGVQVSSQGQIAIKEGLCPYVSRGGLKLEKALAEFHLDLRDKVVLDIGASTGGFSDCALKNGAKQVYAVDVGYGQLAWSLRQDPRVVNFERTNFRHIVYEKIGRTVDLATIDVSFISLDLILPALKQFLDPDSQVVALIKPQFEAGRENVGKRGVVRDKAVHLQVIEKVIAHAETIGLFAHALTFSPVTGPEGNIEYLVLLGMTPPDKRLVDNTLVPSVVEAAHQTLRIREE